MAQRGVEGISFTSSKAVKLCAKLKNCVPSLRFRYSWGGKRGSPLGLHAPFTDGSFLDNAEYQVLDDKADHDHRQEAGEYGRDVEQVPVFENIPAEAALA